jgi:TetR/AcrR family transcriptional regulator, regulator of cefoperazone and chloramphenicol sensitivity
LSKEQVGGPSPEDLTARARIRDAALKHFSEHGFARATIRGIARAAGVSPGLVRHHFGSKEALRQACDEYVLDALRQFNDQALAGGAPQSAGSQSSLNPFERYLARALIDNESTVVASLFDEMVTIGEQWLTRADEGRSDPPPVDRRTRAALMTAMALGIPAFHEHLSRVLDIDVLSAEGDRRVALAILDIYSHSMISPEFADAAKAGLDPDPHTKNSPKQHHDR